MADRQVNKSLVIKRLEIRKREMEINIDKYDCRLIELEEERERVEDNIKNMRENILDIDSQIKAVEV
jgi:hypothetical protein